MDFPRDNLAPEAGVCLCQCPELPSVLEIVEPCLNYVYHRRLLVVKVTPHTNHSYSLFGVIDLRDDADAAYATTQVHLRLTSMFLEP